MKAILKSYRQAPRKVRLVANLIKGKTVPSALAELEVLPKRAAAPMKKLVLSAVANAKENDGVSDTSALFVKEVRVDKGVVLKRFMPRAHGRATPIHKHTSHVVIELIAHSEAGASVKSEKLKVKSEKPKSTKGSVARTAKAKPAVKVKRSPLKTND